MSISLNKFLGNAGLRLLQGAFSILTSIFISKALGVGGYGEFITLFTFVTAISIPLVAGVPMYSMKEMIFFSQDGDLEARHEFLLGLKIYIYGVAFLIFMVCLAWFLVHILIAQDIYEVNPILLGLIAVVIGVNTILSGVIRGDNKLIMCNVPEMGVRSSIFFICAVLVWLFEINNLSIIIYGLLFSCLCSLIISLRLINFGGLCFQLPPNFINWLRGLPPYFLASIFTILSSNCDLLLLAYYHQAGEVGVYKIASQIAAVIPLLSIVYFSTNCHQIHKFYKSKSIEEAKNFFLSYIKVGSLFTLVVLGGFYIFGNEFLRLTYGDELLSAFIPLFILMVSQSFVCIFGVGLYTLNITGNPGLVLGANIIIFIVDLLFGLILVPPYGVLGASLASLIAIIFGHFYSCYRAWGLFIK